jgi:thiamine-phosphate pyrophosphorylase
LLLYYITDRSQFSGDEVARRRLLLEKVGEAANSGVDFIQLRERDLSAGELELLAQDAMRVIRGNPASSTRLLINSRTDVAIAAGADGVHLRSLDISPPDVRKIWSYNSKPPATKLVISVACHTIAEVALAAEGRADFALFGPVFEKKRTEGQSAPADAIPTTLASLKEACQQGIPVIALGGVTPENARACIDAGAAGVAGIRLFQQNQIATLVSQLRHSC